MMFLRSANPFFVMGTIIPAILVLGACSSVVDDFRNTRVGKAATASDSRLPEDILRDSVFSVVGGQTKERAKEILTSDGASCILSTCTWRTTEQETVFALIGIRPMGPKRIWLMTRVVSFSAEVIAHPSDISATIDSTEIKP